MNKTTTGKMRVRILTILILFFVSSFAVLIGRFFYLQIVMGEEYQQLALNQQTRSFSLGAKRGTIYDRNGDELAKSATVWNICVNPKQVDIENFDKHAAVLAEILEIEKDKITEEAKDKSVYYKRIKMRVERDVMEQVLEYITENDVKGIILEEDTKRYYPYGNLASTVLGFTNFDNQGAYGLESYYEKTLSGKSGMLISAKDAWGFDMDKKYQKRFDPQDGNSIVLTIDQSIQHFLERNLETALVEHGIGNRASGIVMDIETGEILAMATKPDFDPNNPYDLYDPKAQEQLDAYPENTEEYLALRKQLWYDQWRNKAISDTYEPGSVFKIITASTALDNKVLSINDHFHCTGSINVSGRNISCWKAGGHGSQNFIQGMQNSCNPVFIAVGQRIGADIMYNYMDNFGFGEVTGIDLPGEAEGIRQTYEVLSKPGMVELSSTSFGQTFKVTPIQLITAVSAAVNGGDLMQPYIVKQILDSDGNIIETTKPVVKRQVISKETSETMRMLTEAVVEGGSGRYSAIPGYRIGGKTGTSEKLDLLPVKKYVLSFVGFAPMEDPKYAILVMLDEPKLDNVFGSVIAAPVVGAVFNEMLPYLGYDPQFTPEQLAVKDSEVPQLIGMKPHDAQAELTKIGLKARFIGSGAEVVKQIPQANQKVPKGSTVILYTDLEELDTNIEVPNVVGMRAKEANEALIGAGLNVQLRGKVRDGIPTRVSEQWPLPGEKAATGEIIIITLVEAEEELAVTSPEAPDPESEYLDILSGGEEETEEETNEDTEE